MINKTYKLLLIKASKFGKDGKLIKFDKALQLALALPYLAALTSPEFDVEVVDEFIDDIDFDIKVDLVGITTLLAQVPRAIEISREFKKRGVTVIAGGVGISCVKSEVESHFDSIIIGEAEDTWPLALDHFKAGKLQKVYTSTKDNALNHLPLPRFDLLNTDKYLKVKGVSDSQLPRVPVETARGCPHKCEYCYTNFMFGHKVRQRPIDDVIEELSKLQDSFFFFVDDNINADPARAKELFKRMIPLNIKWYGQFSTKSLKHTDMLELAQKAGCISAFIGLESISQDNFAAVGKTHNKKHPLPEILRVYTNAGIDVNVGIMVGFDNDTPQSLERTIDFLKQRKVHIALFSILTPFPQTRLFEKLSEEGRILHRNYSLYDGAHVVFKPKNFEPEELEELYWSCYKKFYSFNSILYRFSNILKWGTNIQPYRYTFNGNIFFNRTVRHKIHPLSGGIIKNM